MAVDAQAPAGPSELAFVRALWRAFETGGVAEMLALAHPDVEWSPSLADGAVLRGRDQVVAFMARREAEGLTTEAEVTSFEQRGAYVLAHGSLRVHDGRGFAESHRSWRYRFEGGRLIRADAFACREAALAACDA